MPSAPSVHTSPFGTTPKGEKATLYTLANAHGITVAITDYGALIVSILTPDREGHFENIALGFDSIEAYFTPEYHSENPHFGASIGRFANRIAGGKFKLDGVTYELPKNDGLHSLHGGTEGFDTRVWKSEILEGKTPSVRFSLHSPDGDQGFPGAMDVSVTYALSDENELTMDFEAVSDKKTIVNFTNHTYYNLAGAGNGTILDHELTIPAVHYTPVDATLIPTGEFKKVEGTPLDFRKPHSIRSRINEVGGEPVGYDHNYVLPDDVGFQLNGEVYEPKSGRVLGIYSDQPGVQLYTSNFLTGKLVGKNGKAYVQHGGICLEPQHFPDSPNKPQFPSVVLGAGETYRTRIAARFGVR